MYLKYVQIVNFKNLKNVRFEFSKGANTIIGENDSGKSNALTAIRILLDDNYYYNTKSTLAATFSTSLTFMTTSFLTASGIGVVIFQRPPTASS